MQKELQHPETSWPAVKDPQQYRWISLIQISLLKLSFLLRETLSIRRVGHLPELKVRLFRARAFWLSKLSCPLFVKNIVTYGYALPLKRLSVAEGKTLRLVLDLRHVNQYVEATRFKYEDLKTLAELFEAGFYFFSFDVESGFHHVSVVEHHQQLLGFSWLFPDGKRRFYNFRVLPFGLSSACYVFTKLMRPLVARWRSMGHVSLVYIDDGISDRTSAKAASIIQRKDLLSRSGGFQTTRTCAELSQPAVLSLISKPLQLAFSSLYVFRHCHRDRVATEIPKRKGRLFEPHCRHGRLVVELSPLRLFLIPLGSSYG